MRLVFAPMLRAALALSLLTATGGLSLSATPLGTSRVAPQNSGERILLFILPEGDAKKPKKSDNALALRDKVRETLRDSGIYDVLTFSNDHPQIKRAILERTLDALDIITPISQEAMQRISLVMGASKFLSLVPSEQPKGFKAELLLMELKGPQTWQTRLSETISTGDVIGTQTFEVANKKLKVRINKEDALTILSDLVTVRMGLPSQLNDKLAPLKNAQPKPETPKDEKPKPENPKPENPQPTTAENGGNQVTNPPENPMPSNPTTKKPPKESVTKKPERTQPPRKENSPPITVGTPNGAGADIIANSEQLPLNVQKADSEEQLRRYRQEGDLANVIFSLRRAINDRPQDILLRQQLVQVYQDKGLNDEALSEVERSLLMQPNDPVLLRLYGGVLLARGDVPKSLKAFRDAIRLDPKDIRAQIALGDALLADNQFKEAFEVYDTAAKNAPESPLPHRRLARALLSRAASDLASYGASIEAIQRARAKTPPTDTDSYRDDYVAIIKVLESRLKDMLGEIQAGYQGYKQGKFKVNDLNRALGDIKERSKAAEDYLEKLPAALALENIHAGYQQGASFVTQAISLFRAWLQDGDGATESAFQTAQVNANREINASSMRLKASKERNPAPVEPQENNTNQN